MSNLNDLAARVEALTGPDREIDAEIAVAVDFQVPLGAIRSARTLHRDYGGNNSYAEIGLFWERLPAYTASIDAAMTLVPEGAGLHLDRYWIGKRDGPAWRCEISSGGIPSDPRRVYTAEDAYSAALALTAAALRSRVQGDGNG